jgi:cytochrome c oxidase cbb3-type subunit I/II
MNMDKVRISYDDQIVRHFAWATIIWGAVGMLVGVIVATQMAFWQTNLGPYLSFGRLRPLHTNAVIFAFVGNSIFCGIYYSTQRLLKTRLASDLLSKLHFWGWQLIIVAAAITLPLGISQSKEYAELEWPIDIMIALVWVIFAINFFWTLAKRREKHIYVAIWFYIASIITVAVLHIVNSLSLPVSLFKSYSMFPGVQDALIQWWYGHNAVAFFLTTPVLGLMYYFVPKAVDRPVYSYRLSIIHFWALIFLYIWAGPHHLLFSALPDWAQNLGVVFSVMLWAPSWGGMINGLLTIRGAWDKLRTDPVVKFFAAAITFYGMSTFEGPLLSIKTVNGLVHSTDWIVGHVHGGALGWNGFFAAGMLYWLFPKLYKKPLYSTKLANFHFWVGFFGILLYVAAMWGSGLTQGLMWRAINPEGFLTYPNFIESIQKSRIMYMMRLVGGTLYLVTFLVMIYNLFKTAQGGVKEDTTVEVPGTIEEDGISWKKLVFSPTTYLLIGLITITLLFFGTKDLMRYVVWTTSFLIIAVVALFVFESKEDELGGQTWHHVLEGKTFIFSIMTLVAILIGGIAQIVPAIVVESAVPMAHRATPYTPLELVGRDLYIRDGCNNCHTQMIRTYLPDTLRYGSQSEAWESSLDHPHLWGSKRTGPDIARVGGKYPDSWHYKHMMDPRSISAGSIMPEYSSMDKRKANFDILETKMRTLQKLKVPYTKEDIANAVENARAQSKLIVDRLNQDGIQADADSEMIAMIAYLQKLGLDKKQLDQKAGAK